MPETIVRRGRAVRADLGGEAFVLFVNLPKTLSPEVRARLNELVRSAREALAADEKKEKGDAGEPTRPENA